MLMQKHMFVTIPTYNDTYLHHFQDVRYSWYMHDLRNASDHLRNAVIMVAEHNRDFNKGVIAGLFNFFFLVFSGN